MEVVDTKIFEREITHTTYRNARKTSRLAGYLPMEIQVPVNQSMIAEIDGEKGTEDQDDYIDNKFIASKEPSKVAPQMIGGAALLFLIGSPFLEIEWDYLEITAVACVALLFLISIVYYFTVPKKFLILDRDKSRITIPGFFWKEGYTMPFKNVRLGWGGGAVGSPSPDSLIVSIPNRLTWGKQIHLFGGNYFQELSYLVWYMDRNRPLPPRRVFEQYQKEEYKRRKAAGFPPPLFVSHIPTPEAKDKWQKERDKHWKESMVTNEKGNPEWQLWQSDENIALHGKWQAVPQK